jgi:hypothetical protein
VLQIASIENVVVFVVAVVAKKQSQESRDNIGIGRE